MGYQASSSSKSKIIVSTKTILTCVRIVFVLFGVVLLPAVSFAQTTTNPLFADVRITAEVLISPGTHPENPQLPPPTPINLIDTKDVAIFKGMAYPDSIISLLKNGVVVAELPASPNGTFEIRVRNLDPGTYSFGVRAEDPEHLKSKLLLFTIYLSSGVTTIVDGIFMPPTITSDKIEVRKGEIVTFLGRSVPDADVRLSFHSNVEILKKSKANSNGTWIYKMDSSELELGDHDGKARSLTSDDLSPYSDSLPFIVSNTNKARTKTLSLAGFRKRCDLNDDGRVNLLDFSIMAFWYKRLGFPLKVDLNTDNRVNLTDLSILAYCWTG